MEDPKDGVNESEEKDGVEEDQNSGDNEGITDEELEALLGEDDDSSDDDASDDDSDDSDEESEEETDDTPLSDDVKLKAINELRGTNYRTIEEAKKAEEKLRQVAKSKKTQKKSEPKESVSRVDYSQRLLKIQYPEAEHVMDLIIEEAERSGRDVLDIYETSTFLQNEAKAKSETENVDTSNSKKINKPSAGSTGIKSISDIDLSNPQHAKAMRNSPKLRKKYLEYLKKHKK